MSYASAWISRRFEPIDNACLVVFRALFGALLVAECAGALATGWVSRAFVEPTVRFPMIGFEWLRPLPGRGMYAYYALMAALGVLIGAGLAFRAALGAFLVLWWSAYVMQTAHYNNHYYLIVLLCLLLWTTPADADFSLRARRAPGARTTTCPRWCHEIFVWQTAILYGFAAYAKLQPDWLSARPLAVWLGHMASTRVLGHLYSSPWLPPALAWGGLVFDALVVPALLWSRTRRFAFVAACGFHLFNSLVFRVGVFPYLGIALCIFFFPPEAVRARLVDAGAPKERLPAAVLTSSRGRRFGIAFFALYFALQLLLPLRYHLYPGAVDWHEEGYRMSWRMMLRAKVGQAEFRVHDPNSGETWRIDPKASLTAHQALRLAGRPDMIWLFAQQLRKEFADRGHFDVQVFVDSAVSLNGRRRAPLIDPRVDLAATSWSFLGYNRFITPSPAENGG
jgi:hypothetical protein